ncbi:hypothetical protein SUDANB106_03009 [Streptomyces sp. enrichment culture]|uniref:hypothetical protein n=1 Tax=Streptomyces sp. enrichment culture TaxID=1795815 RepID=UPI003F548423
MGKRSSEFELTWSDLQDSVDADIQTARAQQQRALASGDQESADRHGRAVDAFLDERRSY